MHLKHAIVDITDYAEGKGAFYFNEGYAVSFSRRYKDSEGNDTDRLLFDVLYIWHDGKKKKKKAPAFKDVK